MARRHLAMAVVILLAVAVVAGACGAGSAPTAGGTMGQMAQAGKTLFGSRCARCHGDQGQGVTAPAIIGAGAGISRYNTAQGLYNFVSNTMPLDAPGALSAAEYRQVLAFLLVQNNYAAAETPFDPDQLGSLTLKK